MMKRTVCITGCSRGLGRAAARKFAAEGWRVLGCARSDSALDSLAGEIGDGFQYRRCDVGDAESVRAWANWALQEAGAPDLLLNNAAIINRSAPIWNLDADELESITRINVTGVMWMLREFLPAMLRRGEGVVVNLSSGWGRSTSPEVSPYCATKWAMEGLSQAVAQETGGKVAVVALNPGVIDTAMLRECFGDDAGAYGGAEEWAERAVPFLSDLGLRDNGASLTVPG